MNLLTKKYWWLGLFVGVLILAMGYFLFVSGWLTKKNDSIGICTQKVFSRKELDHYLSSGCDEKKLLKDCGNNIGSVIPLEGGESTTVYLYMYPQKKVTPEFQKKYGKGFVVSFENGHPVDWDVIGLDVSIPLMTQDQLDSLLKKDMTPVQVEAILGEPKAINRNGEQMIYYYFFRLDPKDKERDINGVDVTFFQQKAVVWGTMYSSPELFEYSN